MAKGIGQDTVVVGITWLDEYQGVITKAGSGIKTVADLKGKRLAIPDHKGAVIDFQRGAAQHGFVTALAQAGLTPADATFVDIVAPNYDTQDGGLLYSHRASPYRTGSTGCGSRGCDICTICQGSPNLPESRIPSGH
ncbi:MAG: ABC transporter substrate-binding protein [Nitrosomonadales bacterium]